MAPIVATRFAIRETGGWHTKFPVSCRQHAVDGASVTQASTIRGQYRLRTHAPFATATQTGSVKRYPVVCPEATRLGAKIGHFRSHTSGAHCRDDGQLPRRAFTSPIQPGYASRASRSSDAQTFPRTSTTSGHFQEWKRPAMPPSFGSAGCVDQGKKLDFGVFTQPRSIARITNSREACPVDCAQSRSDPVGRNVR